MSVPLMLFLVPQKSYEAQCPAEVPLPQGDLRDHPEDTAAVPGLSFAQVPGQWHEEGE